MFFRHRSGGWGWSASRPGKPARRPRARCSVEQLEDRNLFAATLLADLNTDTLSAFTDGSGGSLQATPADVNGTLFFVADDGVNGQALWKSDGTAEGTEMVKDMSKVTRPSSRKAGQPLRRIRYSSRRPSSDAASSWGRTSSRRIACTARTTPV